MMLVHMILFFKTVFSGYKGSSTSIESIMGHSERIRKGSGQLPMLKEQTKILTHKEYKAILSKNENPVLQKAKSSASHIKKMILSGRTNSENKLYASYSENEKYGNRAIGNVFSSSNTSDYYGETSDFAEDKQQDHVIRINIKQPSEGAKSILNKSFKNNVSDDIIESEKFKINDSYESSLDENNSNRSISTNKSESVSPNTREKDFVSSKINIRKFNSNVSLINENCSTKSTSPDFRLNEASEISSVKSLNSTSKNIPNLKNSLVSFENEDYFLIEYDVDLKGFFSMMEIELLNTCMKEVEIFLIMIEENTKFYIGLFSIIENFEEHLKTLHKSDINTYNLRVTPEKLIKLNQFYNLENKNLKKSIEMRYQRILGIQENAICRYTKTI